MPGCSSAYSRLITDWMRLWPLGVCRRRCTRGVGWSGLFGQPVSQFKVDFALLTSASLGEVHLDSRSEIPRPPQ